MIELKTVREIELIRESGKIVNSAFKKIERYLRPGITTRKLDVIVAQLISSQKANSAFLGYHGFPGNICISVNEEVVHGIPGERVLAEGDIVSIDIGVERDGYYGDAARTFPIGRVNRKCLKLIDTARRSLAEGIAQARPGNRLGDVSHAVQSVVEREGFSVIRQYVGHGIGRQMHEEPQIANFGPPDQGPELNPGMVLAIEPMIAEGSYEVEVLGDGWTVVTVDRKPAAHFEHTVAITEKGPVILTN